MAVGSTIGAIAGIAGGVLGAKSARSQQKAAEAALAAGNRSAELSPFRSGIVGGPTAIGGPGSLNIDLGPLTGLNAGFGNLATSLIGNGAVQGLPPEVQLANMLSQGALFSGLDTTALSQQGLLTGELRNAFDQARTSLAGLQSFNPALQSTAFTGAAQQAAQAGQGFQDVYNTTLANLRTQAQPFEQRAFTSLQDNLFATGRLGSTGGALQTEAFARGLGQADTARQLEATNQARLTQQNALGLSQGLAALGNQNALTGDALLQNAFGRFSGLAGQLDANLQNRFSNSALLNQLGSQNAQQNLTNQIQLAGLPAGLQSAQLANALQALQGQGALQGMGLNLANFGLAQSQAQGNLQLGQASNAVAAAQNPNLGAQNDFLASLFSGISSRAAGPSGLFGNLFRNQAIDPRIGSGQLANAALAQAGFG